MAMANNMSSREGGFEIEVWADQGPVEACREKKKGVSKKILAGKARFHRHDRGNENEEPSGHVDMAEACREMGGGYGISKKRLAVKAHLHRQLQDKENVNPSGSDFLPFSLPSWHRRYPLQDITTLIHSLQGLQVDIDAGFASSGWFEMEESTDVFPASCKDTNKKRAQLLWMR